MNNGIVTLGHGAGGRLTQRLVADVFVKHFDNAPLRALDDAAAVTAGGVPLAFTTDGYVVKPLFFPGGDIGRLAVCGTINDLAVTGATPLYLSAAFIVEEGLPYETLDAVAASMAATAADAGVAVVCGDTKVVARGEADGVFIATAGVGFYAAGQPARGRPEAGDKIIINGTIGDHAISILLARGGVAFAAPVASDCAPLNGLIAEMLAAAPGIKFMRDPTRGGLATTLNDLAGVFGVGVEVHESRLPVDENVQAVCEALGFDVLHLANEGKVVAVCGEEEAEAMVAAMRRHTYGRQARVIGEVVAAPRRVVLKTVVGGSRIVDVPLADPLPRIC